VSTDPLPYHHAIVAHLRDEVPSAWSHYTSDRYRVDHADAVRLHLLQTTYVLERTSHPELYEKADAVRDALGLAVPVELYQGEASGGLGATLFHHPTVARVVVHGPLFDLLVDDEIRAVLAHELAHHLLWMLDGGIHLDAARVLAGLASITEGSAEHSARLHQLHTEVYCDRAALTVVSAEAAIRALIKVHTSLKRVSAEDFLAQSHTLFDATGPGSAGTTHPEAHLRALCLEGFASATPPDVWALLEGPRELPTLDLLARTAVDRMTRSLVGSLLEPAWFRTEAVLGHTAMLFDDVLPPFEPWTPTESERARWGETLEDYVVALLTDYTAVDPDLDDLPFLRAHQVAESLGLAQRFEDSVYKELKRRRRDIAASLEDRDSRLADAEDAGGEA
jgi:hypothetical protein